MPCERPGRGGDAIPTVTARRYWYSTQPTVTKLAEDRGEQLKRDPDKVWHELELRVRADVRNEGDFSRVHPWPQTSQDVPDDLDARLVVLGIDQAYSKEPGSAGRGGRQGDLLNRVETHLAYIATPRLPRGRQDPPAGP